MKSEQMLGKTIKKRNVSTNNFRTKSFIIWCQIQYLINFPVSSSGTARMSRIVLRFSQFLDFASELETPYVKTEK